jgi:hypothetical protein
VSICIAFISPSGKCSMTRRILEVRQRMHRGTAVSYIGDNPLGPLSQGTVVELRHAQAIVQDSVSRRRWPLPHAAIVTDSKAAPIHPEPAPPPRARREEFFTATPLVSPTNT